MKKESWESTLNVIMKGKTMATKQIIDWTAERTMRANSGTISLRVSYRHVVNMLK